MTHGLLKNRNMEIYSCAGVCLTSLQALKIAFLSIKSNNTQNAVCCASEMVSGCLLAKNFEEEFAKAEAVHKNPYMAFEKDFLRFMLSDGAGAVLLENKKRESGSLEIEWIEISSYAHELPTCMYLGGELDENEELVGWKSFSQSELINKSIFVIKQNIKLLKEHVVIKSVDHIEHSLEKHNVKASCIDYFIPHVSSMFFYGKLEQEMKVREIDIPMNKWFTNLTTVGNIGSASIFLALEELYKSGKLVSGNKILLLVPESGRFAFGTALLTVQ